MPAVDALGLVGTTSPPIRFEACVDSGGFALVYRARHLSLDTEVAVKCLRIAHLGELNDEIRTSLFGRFRDETKILYRLSQGCLDIVRCIGSGEVTAPATGEQTPYMILEWLDGYSLSADMKSRRERGQPGRTLGECIELLDSAANALAYAHEQGVVHRDVKPGNLFFARTPAGVRLKVLDFGFAKILQDEAIGLRPSVETGVGVHFCSPSYGAPEQFSPQQGAVGPWTDVYALTLVILELMKGAKIRPASTLADGFLKAIDPATGSPRASALGLHVSRAVEELLARGVAQSPLERPRDAGAFWSALKELAARGGHEQGRTGTVMMASAPPIPSPDPTPIPKTAKMPDRPPTLPLSAPPPRPPRPVRIESRAPPPPPTTPPRPIASGLGGAIAAFVAVVVVGCSIVWWVLKGR